MTATLYFIIFGSLIGRRVGAMGGFDYMMYIAPGLIMMSVITNSYAQRRVFVLRREVRQAHRGAAGLAAAQLDHRRGYVCGGIMRGLMVGAVVTVVTLLFTHLHVHHVLRDRRGGAADVDSVLARAASSTRCSRRTSTR